MGNDNLLKHHDEIIESLRTKVKNDYPSHDIITDDFQTNFHKTWKNKVENYQKTDSEKFKSYVLEKAGIGALLVGGVVAAVVAPPVGIALAVEAGAAAGGIGFIGVQQWVQLLALFGHSANERDFSLIHINNKKDMAQVSNQCRIFHIHVTVIRTSKYVSYCVSYVHKCILLLFVFYRNM